MWTMRKGLRSELGLVALLALVAALCPTSSSAAEGGSGVSFAAGVHAGVLSTQDSESNGLLVGGWIEARVASVFGVQAGVAYQDQGDFRFPVDNADISLDVSTVPVTLSGVLRLPGPLPVRPYVLAGGGWYHTTYDFSADAEELLDAKDKTETEFGWHAGAGVVFGLSPGFSLYGEFRALFLDPDTSVGEAAAEIEDDLRALDFDSYSISAGIAVGL